MTSNGSVAASAHQQPPAASGVSFTPLHLNGNGESSSQAESRSSWSTRGSDGDGIQSRYEESHTSRNAPSSRDTDERRLGSGTRGKRASGGFLLDSGGMNGSPRASDLPHRIGKRKAQNGFLQVDKRRNPASRLSVDSSGVGSPLSREVSRSGPEIDTEGSYAGPRPPGLDPAQLVQMALELSESRRRGVSGGLKLPSPAGTTSRRSSGFLPVDAVRQASRQRQRASHGTDEPVRRVSGRYSLEPAQDGLQDEDQSQDSAEYEGAQNDVSRNLTPATLSRAERARKYFELASEHRRLLQHLPPLKPDADAPGNHTFVAMNSPGSAHPQFSRVPSHLNNKHSLGRPYNPLQALRNRRLRNRERQTLPAPSETWQDIECVGRWVDEVETATGRDGYRQASDRIDLPTYAGDDGGATAVPETGKGHRRTDTVSSVISRPENGWSIEPTELLADAYWTERGHHKELLENRHGSPLFRRVAKSRGDKPRRSEDTARSSGDMQRVKDEADDVPFHKSAHRGPRLMPRRHGKLTRAGSVSSMSTDGGRSVAHLGSGGDEYENTGPLEKHMQQLIAKYEEGGPTSPVLVSPDHWDSVNMQFPAARGSNDHAHRDTKSVGNGGLSVDTARQHRRAKSADGRVGSIDRNFVEAETSEPTSPAAPGFRPSLDVDRSSQHQQQGTFARQKSKLHKLPMFRSHSKERTGIDRTDFADTGDNIPVTDDRDDDMQPRLSRESARPPFIQRHRTTESVASSVQRQGTGLSSDSTKEGTSTVGRFLKAGRIGELVRNESTRFGDRFRGKEKPEDIVMDMASEASEDEGDDARRRSFADDDDLSPRTSIDLTRSKPKYFLPNLPTFRSPVARGVNGTPGSVESDPIARQQRAQKEAGRSTRFDRLAPPRINLPAEDDEELSSNKSDTYVGADRRKSYGFLGAASSNGSSVSFTEQGPVGRASNMKSQGRRHWSISDKPHREQLSKVSARDVARVRALLLSSGVKAREIQRRADSPRGQPLSLYTKIGEMVGKEMQPVALKEEHLLASRMLSDHLSLVRSKFGEAMDRFQNDTAKRLNTRLEQLGRKAAEQLTTTVHDTSDDADAFIVELTTKVPQDVKRVDDAIDEILRERRRQFRLLRRAGFKLLEWLVLGIMWAAWGFVVCFQLVKRVVVGLVAFLKWLFSF